MGDSDLAQSNDQSLATSRSRRTLKDRHGRKAAFERLKELKGGKNKFEVAEVKKIYDEVEEREYAKRRQNRMEEDWIVDDDGSGYVEDGREIFDDEEDDFEGEAIFTSKRKSKPTSNKGKTTKALKSSSSSAAAGANLKQMFSNIPTKKRKIETKEMTESEKALLEECLKEEVSPHQDPVHQIKLFDQKPVKVAPKPALPFATNFTAEGKQVLKNYNRPVDKMPLVAFNPPQKFDSRPSLLTKCDPEETSAVSLPAEEEKIGGAAACDDENLLVAVDDPVDEPIAKDEAEAKMEVEDVLKEKVETKKMNDWEESTFWVEENSTTAEVHIDTSELPLTKNSEGEKVFRFYWLDAYEDMYGHAGVVYLFGKVYIEAARSHVSCCVVVKNVERKIFILPRLKRLDLKTKIEGEEVTMSDVYQEFNEVVAKKYKIRQFKMRKSTKRYCFEKSEVPDEAEFMEVRYAAEYPILPQNLEGETFSHVFGTNSSSLELLLLENKIKGPGWLDLKNPLPSSPPVSWCKIEVIASKPSSVVPILGPAAPPLNVVSLRFRTIINPKTHQNEIIMVTCLNHKEYSVAKQPSKLFQSHWCALAKPPETVWPWDLKAKLETYRATTIEKTESERSLLGYLLVKLYKIDPDVIIGHDIYGYDLSILLHRIQVNKIPHWSRIGRLRRTQMPKLSNKGFAERAAVSGRLICDTKVAAKELIRAKSYDLGPLVQQVLRIKDGGRAEFSMEDIKKTLLSSSGILTLVNCTMQDTFYNLQLVSELNVLPLAFQITNIAGNVLSRTLLGGRSERNEFLLLHAFTENGYICPDKQQGRAKQESQTQIDNEVTEGSAAESSKNGRKKASYAGGLVLEPKKGFYDKYILLMDFNSLYPSIIQEYNICFTTINRDSLSVGDGDVDVPEPDQKPGILPGEIRKLVESRREVKKLMKQTDISAEQKQQYDIRQKALKITANSMYGCLGFQNSRFFARHLAALITGKGRDILLNTKNVVEKLNFEVVYGDTDSIMINTNCSDYDQVFKLGQKIKQEINKLYKLLELEVDGVFKYMLLLKKKKYAAVTISKLGNGDTVEEKEFKGLDIVRRDWSQIASDAGKYILDQVLSDLSPDERVERIHSYLESIKTMFENQKVSLDDLAITKQLTKDPTEYPDKNSLPHVQVALRLNSQGTKKLRQGDTVPYVICEDEGNQNIATRAFHVDEVKGNEKLRVDVQYYLAHQVHPVISRLCDPIDGTDASRIADCLGLDGSKYHGSHSGAAGDLEEEVLVSDVSEEEKYRMCKRFSFKCPAKNCQMLISLDQPTKGSGSSTELALSSCPDPSCKTPLHEHLPYILNKLRTDIRTHVNLYYQGWMLCEDPGCNNRTRQVPLQFKRGHPVCSRCSKGLLFREFSESQLYLQLSFYDYVFDFQKGCHKNKEIRNRNEALKRSYFALQSEVQSFLSHNGFSTIDLGSIFSHLYINSKPVKHKEFYF